MPTSRALPGIRIDVAPPPPTDVLPRMDIAVFVGFATKGPAHTPVPVESVAQYAAVFGPDAPLAWDDARRERLYANLGPCVRAFFSNGGRRCLVIRVTRTAALEHEWRRLAPSNATGSVATVNRFAMPGVLAASRPGAVAPAIAQARSLGSWSDPLRLSTALVSSGFVLSGAVETSPGIAFTTDAALRPGDLVELGDLAAVGAARVFATVDQVTVSAGTTGHVRGTICAAFAPLQVGSPHFIKAGRVDIAQITVAGVSATLEPASAPDGGARLQFTHGLPDGLAPGHWARWSDDHDVVWFHVDATDGRSTADGPAWREQPLRLPHPEPTRGSVLTLDLRVAVASDDTIPLRGVGLTPSHLASWWNLVSDDMAYAPGGPAVPGVQPSPDPAFPLCAPDAEAGAGAPLALIPLGVDALDGTRVGAMPQAGTPLERDGLARFDAELFLDPALAPLRADALIGQADMIRFLGDAPRALFGAHAALSAGAGGVTNEPTLLAIPDAVHVGWVRRAYAQAPAATPAPEPAPSHWFTHHGPCAVAAPDATASQPDFANFLDCGTRALAGPRLTGPADTVSLAPFNLTWTTAEGGATYVVEEAWRTDFGNAREIYRGSGSSAEVDPTREGIFYYRVVALAGDERSPASNVVSVAVRGDEWVEADTTTFGCGGERELARIHRGALRLAAASSELFVVLGLPRHYGAVDAVHYSGRLKAAPEAPGADAEAFRFTERRALSYGALYHPWAIYAEASDAVTEQADGITVVRQVPPTQRACPPDGLAAGVLAARANARGAWIAPANEPFRDVVALTPPLSPDAWQALQDGQINFVRADARGFLTLAADTLSDALQWQPINVRRLMILLRRLALLRGASYVFEPNGDTLRRSVERGFELLLTDLFRRGAFAGDTAADSFKVVTDETINTAAARDAGRFLVELRVAPSLPLQFLIVRLVQSGERLTVAEGA